VIRSSLIEPLVGPLVSRRRNTTKTASTGLSRSRLAATALVSALVAIAAPVEEAHATQQEATVYRTAHKPGTVRVAVTPPWSMDRAAGLLTRREDLVAPQQSAEFDHETVEASRYRHRLRMALNVGPGLSRGRLLDRLLSASDLAYLNFGSARVLAAQPHN
jgi:hypothetical protein